ncbi:MAG TPA: HEAT repeat domain-containing protein [Nannocystaceae bacterium]|nr:HEAT repeat domain-containing protein [Nannocystaceae bacterium]
MQQPSRSMNEGRVRAWALGGVALGVLVAACGGSASQVPPPKKTAPAAAATAVDDDALAGRYQAAKERVAGIDPADAMALKGALNELGPQLREIADKAKAPHLRANASLLLGSLYEQNGDRTAAIAFYRQSMALLPKEVEPARVLALALGADGQFVEAVALQRRVVEDDMDDLAAWLLLGELLVKAGDGGGASEAYVAYEVRRKGLIDGLTLRGEGGFVKSPEERAGCALALAPAADNGTAIALIYALKNEADPKVRAAIVETMGIQHLAGYKQTLEERQASEDDAKVREVIAWALGEIARDPLDTRPGPAPQVAAPGEGTAGEAAAPAGANATAGAVTSTR